MYDIVTVGGASVDLFVKAKEETRRHKDHTDICYHMGEKILVDDLLITTGGGATNTAVAFSRLGLKTGCVAIVGDDAYGEMVLKELHEENVDFLGPVRSGKTGFSVVLAGEGDRTILVYKGLNNELEYKDIYMSSIDTRWFYLSTLLGKGFDTIREVAAFAHKHKIQVACNTSMYLAKEGVKVLSPFLKNIDILILNKEELFAMIGGTNIEKSMRALHRYVKGIVVVTDGSNPSYAFDGMMFHKKDTKRVKIVDSTGAGDAFGAGFVYGRIMGQGLFESLEYGEQEAASTLKEVGAKNNLLRSLGVHSGGEKTLFRKYIEEGEEEEREEEKNEEEGEEEEREEEKNEEEGEEEEREEEKNEEEREEEKNEEEREEEKNEEEREEEKDEEDKEKSTKYTEEYFENQKDSQESEEQIE